MILLRRYLFSYFGCLSSCQVTKRDESDDQKVQALSGVAGEGDKVWVKVISIKEEETGNPKIGVSMKLVNQGSGLDKDPSNTKLEEQQSKPAWQGKKKVGPLYSGKG